MIEETQGVGLDLLYEWIAELEHELMTNCYSLMILSVIAKTGSAGWAPLNMQTQFKDSASQTANEARYADSRAP